MTNILRIALFPLILFVLSGCSSLFKLESASTLIPALASKTPVSAEKEVDKQIERITDALNEVAKKYSLRKVPYEKNEFPAYDIPNKDGEETLLTGYKEVTEEGTKVGIFLFQTIIEITPRDRKIFNEVLSLLKHKHGLVLKVDQQK